MQKQRLQKIAVWIFKLFAFLIAWWYIYYKLSDVSQDFTFLIYDSHFSKIYLAIVVILMFFNWGFEVKKWQFLVSKIQLISFFKSLAGVFVGLPLALITPNRVGEIGGRAIVVSKNRKKIMFVTFIGSMLQLFTTLLFGVLGFVVYSLFLPYQASISIASFISISILFILMVLFYFFKDKRWVKVLFLKISGKNNYAKILRIFRLYVWNDIFKVLLLSIARYVVFAGQFCILLHMFLPELTFIQLFVGISLTYFFTTIIPTSILGEIGIRGSVAMFVFSFYTNHEIIVFQVSILIWLINIVIPTIAGSFILLNLKSKKN